MTPPRSSLCDARTGYAPKLPAALRLGIGNTVAVKGRNTRPESDSEIISRQFPATFGAPVIRFHKGKANDRRPLRVGVVLSGGQAPGGHNVISGIMDGVMSAHPDSSVLGFVGGPAGLVNGYFIEITPDIMDRYRNAGGFDIIGSGRTKLETDYQFDRCATVARENNLDAIVIIGGDDSNTNGAVLAEYFVRQGVKCSVIGCPKTIDGDLKNEYIETPFGFDTASKTYAQLIGNIARDANSARKYWHFIRIMGRSASHIGLEVALQTQPNHCIISEEVASRSLTLAEVVKELTDVVAAKIPADDRDFGVAIIPEGLLEFIPEFKRLIRELNDVMSKLEASLKAAGDLPSRVALTCENLSGGSRALFKSLPSGIQAQLMHDRDPHGNVQVSFIETEKLLIELVEKELQSRTSFRGKFKAVSHFFGYEGRCAHPSNFDADYAYSLGFTAAALAQSRMTGYMSAISNLARGVDRWEAGGIPTSMLMNIERQHGEEKPVIKKALVKLDGEPFNQFAARREDWARTESYIYPGSIQYFGPPEICDTITKTLALDSCLKMVGPWGAIEANTKRAS